MVTMTNLTENDIKNMAQEAKPYLRIRLPDQFEEYVKLLNNPNPTEKDQRISLFLKARMMTWSIESRQALADSYAINYQLAAEESQEDQMLENARKYELADLLIKTNQQEHQEREKLAEKLVQNELHFSQEQNLEESVLIENLFTNHPNVERKYAKEYITTVNRQYVPKDRRTFQMVANQ